MAKNKFSLEFYNIPKESLSPQVRQRLYILFEYQSKQNIKEAFTNNKKDIVNFYQSAIKILTHDLFSLGGCPLPC